MIDMSAVQNNIFHEAHDAIWRAFPWHKGAASPHSSQALAVSVFGTLAVHYSRQVLVDQMVQEMFGWELSEDDVWQVDLEVNVPRGLLGERRRTQADVLLQNKTSVVFLECKFTEVGGGPCSQPQPRPSGKHAGLYQCNGNYKMQTNCINGREARCALSAKGIRYWEYIPEYLNWASDQDYEPCPFAGPAYQYMRNALAAACWVNRHKLNRAAFGLVYVDGVQFPMSGEVVDPASEWSQFVRHLRPSSLLTVRAISYQSLLKAWHSCLPHDTVLTELTDWFYGKIRSIEQDNPGRGQRG